MTASPGLAPSAAVRPPPPRLRSRAFSAPQRFPGTPGLRGLVSCRSHPWGSSLRSLAPRRGRAPLSGPLASLRFSTGRQFRAARARPCAPGFTDAHAHEGRGGLDPHRSFLRRFHRACVSPRLHGFPDALDRTRQHRQVDVTGFVRFEAFFPPRSRTTAPAKRRAWPLLPWASAPPERCSGRPSDPLTRRTVPSTRGLAHPRDDEGCDPSPSGEAGATSRPSDLVGASTRGATADRDVPPLGGIPASLDLGDGTVECRRVALGGVKHVDQRAISER